MIEGIKVCHIVATAANSTIGNNGDLPWKGFGMDLQRFKQKTLGHVVIVGRVTMEGMPYLKGRHTIVLTTDESYQLPAKAQELNEKEDSSFSVANSVTEALELGAKKSKELGNDRLYVIGGESVYAATAAQTDVIEMTLTGHMPKGDAHYPANLVLLASDIRTGAVNGERLGEELIVSGESFTVVERQGSYQSDTKPSRFMYDFITLEKKSVNQ